MEALRIESNYHPVDVDAGAGRLRQILIVDDSLSDIERVTQLLRAAGMFVSLHAAREEADIQAVLRNERIELVLVRVAPGLPPLKTLVAGVRKLDSGVPVVALLGGDGPRPVDLLRAGADDVVVQDDPAHLALVVGKELRRQRQRARAQWLHERRAEVESRFEALFGSLDEPVAYIEAGKHVRANAAYCQLFGFQDERALLGVSIAAIAAEPQERNTLLATLSQAIGDRLEDVNLSARGLHADSLTTFAMQLCCSPVQMGEQAGFQVIARVAEPARADVMRETVADPLTGLFDRRAFLNQLNKKREGRIGVLYILLTGYRASAQGIGLEATDRLAIDIGKRIGEIVGDDGSVAHFADAVFTVSLEGASEQMALDVAQRIRDAVGDNVTHVARKLVLTSCAIGLTMGEGNRHTAYELLSQADQACEVARRAGENEIRCYEDPAAAVVVSPEQQAAEALRAAISADRLQVCFQPIAAFSGAEYERFAVSARMSETGDGLASLDAALHAAEPALRRALERLVIARAIECLALAQLERRSRLQLFLPISATTLIESDFLTWIETLLTGVGRSGSGIVLAIDEAVAESHLAEVKRLDAYLRERGSGLCLSKAAQLARSDRLLRHLKPSFASIDGALIDTVMDGRDSGRRDALLAYAECAREVGTEMVAVNIHCASQMAGLWQFGIELVQGDLVQQPMTEMNFDFKQFAA